MANTLLANTSPLLRIDLLRNKENWFDFKNLCPLSDISKENIESIDNIFQSIRNILFAMNILDELFMEITGFKRHIYILGDGTIFNFLAKDILYKDITNIDKSYWLEIICTLGLSYRFNVAKKFGYSDTNVMQLRLNGWGRSYCLNKGNINDYKYIKKSIYKHWISVISKYKSEYIDLVALSDSTERPLQINKIHEINKIVPIKLIT